MTRLKKINNQKINSNKKDALGVFLETEEGECMYLLEGWGRNWKTLKPRNLSFHKKISLRNMKQSSSLDTYFDYTPMHHYLKTGCMGQH